MNSVVHKSDDRNPTLFDWAARDSPVNDWCCNVGEDEDRIVEQVVDGGIAGRIRQFKPPAPISTNLAPSLLNGSIRTVFV